jgi:peptidoglycan/xylan/chitin deacetylase (PgdA/CDA1 family)
LTTEGDVGVGAEPKQPLHVAAYDLEADPAVSVPAARALADVHRRHCAPATFFIVTQLLEAAGPDYRAILDDPLFDIQSHTHTHLNMKASPLDEVRREVELSRRLIADTLGREVSGLTTPGAYTDGLLGCKDLLGLLWESGIRFVRSDGRGPDGTVPAPFTQPYWYGQDGYWSLLEVPPQFWHDNILKGYTGGRVAWPPIVPWGVPPAPPETPEEEFAVWRLGADYVLKSGLRVYQPTLHPWSICRMSPDARQIDLLLGYVRDQGMEIVSCREVYERAHDGREMFPNEKPETPSPSRWDWPRPSLLSEGNHDARTPLHPIVGFSELLALGAYGPLTPQQQEAADEILRCAERLAYVFEQLVMAEKLAARRIPLNPEVISVEAVARQVRAQAEDLSEGRAEVEVSIEPGAEAILADEERLLDATSALLRNAIGFHPGNPRIRFAARRAGDRVLIELADDGPGIPPAVGARAFRPLVRGGEPRPSIPAGIGLGLTVASGLVRLLGGELRLQSSTGAGTTFVLDLIAAEPPTDR